MRVDQQRDRKGRYVFTGSQQFGLIKNLGDSLAGRIALLELLPFCLPEKRLSLGPAAPVEAFRDAALVGSFPELVIDRTICYTGRWPALFLRILSFRKR